MKPPPNKKYFTASCHKISLENRVKPCIKIKQQQEKFTNLTRLRLF